MFPQNYALMWLIRKIDIFVTRKYPEEIQRWLDSHDK